MYEKEKKTKYESDVLGIDWEEYKGYLDSLFFKRSDLIKVGSQDYHDFWGLYFNTIILSFTLYLSYYSFLFL